MSTSCSQCGTPAERCVRCGGALCTRRLCAELHEASCAAVTALPAGPRTVTYSRPKPARRRDRTPEAERLLAEQLVETIGHHRQVGRTALLAGDLDTAFDQLWAARQLEPDLDRLGAEALAVLPLDWEIETDLTPLARTLSARSHSRAADAWRRLLEDRPARSIQAEAAAWLASNALVNEQRRPALRMLHAASHFGHPTDARTVRRLYQEAGLDADAASALYLAASRLEPLAARAVLLRDPLTDALWSDQDGRWWTLADSHSLSRPLKSDHQAEALGRARDLAVTRRDEGWVMLAEGDLASGPLGARNLGRGVRSGTAELADQDAFVRIRLAYEGAADRLPDVAWPWYRLAELVAWAGFTGRVADYLSQADRRSLGSRDEDRAARPLLRALVNTALGHGPDGIPTAARPFPAYPFKPRSGWRFPFR